MRLTHLHPGVTMERVAAKTGFAYDVAPDVAETAPPTMEEIQLLRKVIDPLGIRRLELLGGAERRVLMRKILMEELAMG